jgi:cyclopropane fatty-acyl-phospholipid synthase-like methyltransferase
MLEHVGAKPYDSYFASIARLIAAEGFALVHSIAASQRPRRCNRWINKYIFPAAICRHWNRCPPLLFGKAKKSPILRS